MKKFLQTTVLFTLTLLAIHVNARSKVTISTTMPTAIKVIIDGQKFYSQDNYLSIRNIQPGYHNISVYYIKVGRDFNNFFGSGSNNYWKKAVSRQVVVRNNYQYDITINRFGRPFYDQDYYYGGNNNNYGWRTDGSGTSENDDDEFDTPDNSFDINSGYTEDYNDVDFFKKKPAKVVDENKNSNNNIYNNNNFDNSSYKPMSNEMFTQVKQTLQKTSFESSKLSIAKQVLDNNSISTSQVKEIMNLFTMQSDKLEYAKYAYDKTRDRNNYFTVINNLVMQSDKDELMGYIRDKK